MLSSAKKLKEPNYNTNWSKFIWEELKDIDEQQQAEEL